MKTNPLWTRFANGDEEARQQLLTEHLGLVYFVSRQVAGSLSTEVEFDELVSAGTLGLMNALKTFDPNRGLAFSTFAAPRIRGAMLDELRRQDHVPRSIRRKTRQINAASERLGRSLEHEPTDRETAEQLGVDLETLWRWQVDAEGAVHVSLDRSTTPDDDMAPAHGEMLATPESDGVEERVTFNQEVGILREALLALREQERVVLSLYYFEELKLHEIATIMELTESRVSQIRSRALAKLRKQMAPVREQVA